MNHDDNTQPPAAPVPPVAPNAPIPLATTPQPKKRTKALVWSLVGGAIMLVIIVIAVVSLLGSSGTKTKTSTAVDGVTHQQYSDAAQAASSMITVYGQYRKAISPRADLDYQLAMSNLNIARENYDRIDIGNRRITGESKPYLAVDETRLAAIEQAERAAAIEMVAQEKVLDEVIGLVEDPEVQRAYEAYVSMRTRLYGEGRTAQQHVESAIWAARVDYGCMGVLDTVEFVRSADDAKKVIIYSDGCKTALRDAQQSNALDPATQEFMRVFEAYLTENQDLLLQMLAANRIEPSRLEAVAAKHVEALGDGTGDEALTLYEDVRPLLTGLYSMLTDKEMDILSGVTSQGGSGRVAQATPGMRVGRR